jgi:hypothetical protein
MKKLLIFALLLSPLPGQNAATALQHAREVNLERAAKLPDFVADEMAIRYKSHNTNPPRWEFVDKIELEINVRGAGTTRQNVRRNGKPWDKANFPPFNWVRQFGYELKPLFATKCPMEIEFEGREEVRGKQLLAYRYHARPDNCFGALGNFSGIGVKNYNPARTGRFLLDDPGGNLVYFEGAAGEFPKGFGMDTWKQTSSWDYVQIGDSSHLLPVSAPKSLEETPRATSGT